MDIGAWLRELGLGRYAQAFQDNEVDARSLPHLTADDLKELGVAAIGHRRLLLQAIVDLQQDGAAAATPVPAESLARASVERGGQRASAAERRQLSVMFCDLVGSTALAGRLDPEDMGEVIRTFQECCAAVVQRWGGYVAKYMGDGVLVYFGYPKAHEDDAERAIRAGLDLTKEVGALTAGDAAPAARVGIATGLVVVGDLVGEAEAQERAVVGETPNLAARLQGLAESGAVVIAPGTRRLLGDLFELRDLGAHDLKGFAAPIQAWRVLGSSRAESRFEALHSQQLTALVGREHEIGLLLDRWERAREGEGQVVLLSGEPGIGKSRIVQALRVELTDQPHTSLSHYCSPYHTNSALHPVIGQLERTAGFTRGDQANAKLDKLEALLAGGPEVPGGALPLVATLLGIERGERYPAPTLSPQRQKQGTLEMLVGQVESLAGRHPVLAVYEDVHWVDPTTLELLDLLIERVQHLQVLVLITFRPEFSPRWTGHAHVMQLTLSRLTRRHGQTLVAAVTGGRELPDEVREQIIAKTDGVPLFVEELTKTVLESGLLVEVGNRFDLAGRLSQFAIPSTLLDSLMARLDRLGSVKEVAQIGATIGREFTYDLLAEVSGRQDADLTAALDQLVVAEVIFRRGAPPDAVYRFKHALFQDAAYQSLLRSRRQQLHRLIAETLQAQLTDEGEQQPQALAHHFAHAGMPATAIPHFVAAAKQAVASNANREAEGYCALGLDQLQELAVGLERDRLELDLKVTSSVARMASLGPAQSQETLADHERIRELAEKVDDPSSVCSALHGVWQNYTTVLGDHGRAADVARQMLSVGERHANREAIFQGRRYLGTSMLFKGMLAQTHHHIGLAMSAPYEHHDAMLKYSFDPIATGKSIWSLALWLSGNVARSDQLAAEALLRAKATNNVHTEAFARHYARNVLLILRRDFAAASQAAGESLALATQYGLPHFGAMAKILRGTALVLADADRAGCELAREGLAELEHVRWCLFRSFFLSVAATAAAHVGDVTSAKAWLSEAHECDRRSDERWAEAEIWRTEGEILTSQGQADDAEACFRRAIDLAKTQEARSWELRAATSLARLWRDRGERDMARDLVAAIHERFTDGVDTADLRDAKALLDELA